MATDYLLKASQQPALRSLVKSIGLPTPATLQRGPDQYAGQPLGGKRALVTGATGGFALKTLQEELNAAGAELADAGNADNQFDLLVFDATGIDSAEGLKALYEFLHPLMRRINHCGRVLIVAREPSTAGSVAASTAAQAVLGFTKSVGKEIGKRGATANVLYVQQGAESRLAGPLRFFLSGHAAYVDGQSATVSGAVQSTEESAGTQPLKGKVALVTGGARGIGAATATRLSAEGATVVVLDIPADREALQETATRIGGVALPADVTAEDTPQKLVEFFSSKYGGVDIVVHNAGVTRDKLLANMKEQFWDMVLDINLAAILRIDEALINEATLRDNGRIVCLSSIGGIAGNVGQTNYAATKAGLMGYVTARSKELAKRGICINAVAPGFIETRMTAAIPFVIREAGRRMSSLSQGGQPLDVAELITFLSTPGAVGITGNTIRVCGQNLVGA